MNVFWSTIFQVEDDGKNIVDFNDQTMINILLLKNIDFEN